MTTYLQRFLEIKQAWTQFNDHTTAEKIERTNDIQALLNALEKKIASHQSFQNTKVQVFEEELNKIAIQIDAVRASLEIASQNEKKAIQYSKYKTNERCFEICQDIQNSAANILKQHQDESNKIKESVQKENKQQIADLTKKVNEISQIKQFVEKRLISCYNAHKSSLTELSQRVQQQVKSLQGYLGQRRLQKEQKQEKLKYMAENLLFDMEKCIQKEQKLGKINYQCQLNLIEDFHTYVKSKSTLI